MGTLGDDLRQAREAAGLSRADLSARTKIRPTLLEAMERNDFGQLPSGVIGRGRLRAYAQEVGLDPNRLVERFEREWMTEAPPPKEVPADESRQRIHGATLIVGVAVVTALALLTWALGPEPEAGDADVVGTAGVAAVATPPDGLRGTSGTAVSPQAAPPASSPRIQETLALELNPTGTVWVEARADGQRVLYSLVGKGDRRLVEANEEIQLRLGNAGALDYSLNGKPGRPFGNPGEVRDIRITRANVPTFQE